MKKEKMFYGWLIVAAGCVVMATTMGIVYNCNSLFIKPISEDLGISRQSVSTMQSLMNLGTMLASAFAGRIFKEDNIVKVMKAAIVVMVVCYFANGFAQNIWMLYVTHIINGVAECLVTTLPLTFLINNWFRDKVGLALGLTSMGSGFGGALFNALAGQLITAYGWRMTYRILAGFILLLAVPCIFFVLKLTPEEKGLKPYTDPLRPGAKEAAPRGEDTGITYAEARRSHKFWLLCVLVVLTGISMNTMYGSVSPHLQDSGYSLAFSANFVSLGMLVLAGGKILLGRIFDSAGVRIAFELACISLLFALVGLYFCRFLPALLLVLFGNTFGCIFGAVVLPLTIPAVFGKKDYRAIMGPLAALLSLGGVIGPIFSGRIYDMYGSYNPAYIIAGIILIGVILILWKILPDKEHQY